MLKKLKSFFSFKPFKHEYFLNRESNPSSCSMSGVSSDIVELALEMFCDAFGIPENQKYCVRPEDKLMDVYKTYAGFQDELEFETLIMNIESTIGHSIDDELIERPDFIQTVEDLILFLDKELQEVSY